jgi:hypothetical protein
MSRTITDKFGALYARGKVSLSSMVVETGISHDKALSEHWIPAPCFQAARISSRRRGHEMKGYQNHVIFVCLFLCEIAPTRPFKIRVFRVLSGTLLSVSNSAHVTILFFFCTPVHSSAQGMIAVLITSIFEHRSASPRPENGLGRVCLAL